MIKQLTNLNWLSILVAFIPYFILGYLWFEVFFKKQYYIALGKDLPTTPQKPAPIFIVGPMITTLVTVIASAILIYILDLQRYNQVLGYSLFLGLGFLVSNTINIAINPNMPKPLYYGFLVGIYHLIGFTISNIIILGLK
ncbi:DUF1761 domain-containing protein [Chryseobacterium sp. RLHN22]|uniref:DUF1761 domain-containing protein n=1 Tax=Chryseobacterium sp. RLHN22 TaxID=3437885 RepID=UPI003D9AB82E